MAAVTVTVHALVQANHVLGELSAAPLVAIVPAHGVGRAALEHLRDGGAVAGAVGVQPPHALADREGAPAWVPR